MSYVHKLSRPYTYKVLINAYVYTQRNDFFHADFKDYYTSLVGALEEIFTVKLCNVDTSSLDRKVLWGLFTETVHSLLKIGTPWSGYLEAGLLVKKLQDAGDAGKAVFAASERINVATAESELAHYEMLHHLFIAMFGERQQVLTSEDLLKQGFDDAHEPEFKNYYDYL